MLVLGLPLVVNMLQPTAAAAELTAELVLYNLPQAVQLIRDALPTSPCCAQRASASEHSFAASHAGRWRPAPPRPRGWGQLQSGCTIRLGV